MKNLKIILLATLIAITSNSAIAQDKNSKAKTIFLTQLIKIDAYLTESSNTDYDNPSRIMLHNKAIDAYKEFKMAHDKLEPDLSVEIKKKLTGVLNVYGQFAEKKNFQYLKDASAKTALAVCSASIIEITDLLLD